MSPSARSSPPPQPDHGSLFLAPLADRAKRPCCYKQSYADKAHKIETPWLTFGDERFALIGNFPYNISSQIVFKVLENRDQIPLFGGMFQKEVAQRLCAGPGNKTYGILSVLCQAYFDLTYDFTVPPEVFSPPPKVESGVMHMVRRNSEPGISFKLLKRGVKAGFGQRRKTLRNALKVINLPEGFDHPYLSKRAEQLGYEEFVELLNAIEDGRVEH